MNWLALRAHALPPAAIEGLIIPECCSLDTDGAPKGGTGVSGARLACPTEPSLAAMNSSGNGASPSRQEPTPLPECLTRLLGPQRLDAGYIAQAAGPVLAGGSRKTYARVLASIWSDLDRLGQLTEQMVNR
jgi:hypothetical protein